MGGNRFKQLKIDRATNADIFDLYFRVRALLNPGGTPGYERCTLVPWVLNKTDHGDIDLLVEEVDAARCETIRLALGVQLHPDHYVSDGDVTSYAVPMPTPEPVEYARYVQLDLIHVMPGCSDFAELFYSNGGLGGLLGRVAAWHGFRFTQRALFLRRTSDAWSSDIQITDSIPKALGCLGYAPERRLSFQTETEVWEYVMSSSLVKPWMFNPELTSADNRSRDKARPAYGRFREWLRSTYPSIDLSTPVGLKPQKRADAIAHAQGAANFNVRETIEGHQAAWNSRRMATGQLGMGAVRYHFPDVEDLVAGTIVRDMQPFLPTPNARGALIEVNGGEAPPELIAVAREAALVIGVNRFGLTPCVFPGALDTAKPAEPT